MVNDMAKVILIYDSKYGNTKRVAELIAEGMGELGGMKPTVNRYDEIKDVKTLGSYDVILIGYPIHFGSPSKAIMKFIDRLAKVPLQGKGFGIFDTHIEGSARNPNETGPCDYENAVKKIDQKFLQKLPSFHKVVPDLYVKVQGIKGPIAEEEIPKCKEYGKKIASQLK